MISLPLHVEPDQDYPEFAGLYVDCTIDDRPYRMLLDTGAAQTWIASDAYTETLEVMGQKQSQGVFSVARADELVALGKLTFGPIEKTALPVIRFTNPERPNLIGMDVLDGMTMVVDFDKSELRFAPGGSLPTSWPLLRSPRGHPYLDLHFPGATGLSCWDTGASVTQVNTAFVAEHPSLFTPIGDTSGTDATGATFDTPMYRMAAATVGAITIAPHTVVAAPLPQHTMAMDFVLGYPALRQFNWTMDFAENLWGATPAG